MMIFSSQTAVMLAWPLTIFNLHGPIPTPPIHLPQLPLDACDNLSLRTFTSSPSYPVISHLSYPRCSFTSAIIPNSYSPLPTSRLAPGDISHDPASWFSPCDPVSHRGNTNSVSTAAQLQLEGHPLSGQAGHLCATSTLPRSLDRLDSPFCQASGPS